MKKTHTIEKFSDEDLIARAKRGHEKAFVDLVKKYEHMVYNFSFKVCRDKDKAEETLQDTFVNVFRKLNQYDGKSKFTTWLYSIVTNNCLMKHRQRKMDQAMVYLDAPPKTHDHDAHGEPIGDQSPIPPWKKTPLDEMMTRELRQLLDDAIQKLPLDYRIVFVLRDIEGQSAEETAKILKLTVPAVKSRVRRARVFLRNQLHAYMMS